MVMMMANFAKLCSTLTIFRKKYANEILIICVFDILCVIENREPA